MSRKSKSSKSKADKQVKSGESTGRSAPADNERNTHANNEGGIAESSSSSDSDDIMPAEGSSTDKLVAVNVVDKGCTGTTAGLINLDRDMVLSDQQYQAVRNVVNDVLASTQITNTVANINRRVTTLGTNVEAHGSHLDSLGMSVTAIGATIETLSTNVAAIDVAAIDDNMKTLDAAIENQGERTNTLERQVATVETHRRALTSRIDRGHNEINAKIDDLTNRMDSLHITNNEVIQNNEQGLKTHGNRLRDFTTEYDRRITRVASTMTEEFTGINQKVDQLRAEFTELRDVIRDLRNYKAQLRNDTDELRNDVRRLRNELRKTPNEIAQIRNDTAQGRNNMVHIRQPAVAREVALLPRPQVSAREEFAAPRRRAGRIVQMPVQYPDGMVRYQLFEEDDLALPRQDPQQAPMGYGYPRQEDRSDDPRYKRLRED